MTTKLRAKIPLIITLAGISIIMIFPVVFVIMNSFTGGAEIINRYSDTITPGNAGGLTYRSVHFAEFTLFPSLATLSQYERLLFQSPDTLMTFWRSVAVALPVTAGQVMVSVCAAFAFEHLRWRFKEGLYFAYILAMLMPLQVLLVPRYHARNRA